MAALSNNLLKSIDKVSCHILYQQLKQCKLKETSMQKCKYSLILYGN